MDILKLSGFPYPSGGICYTSTGLGAYGGEGIRPEFWSHPKSPSLRVWLFLVQLVTVLVGHSLDVKHRPQKYE